ncbi:MAG: hypothetical protein WC389_19315 [Lutibacter sp.]|jgi:hypothetical protein
MTCEAPLRPAEIAELSALEPICPGDSGIDLPTPATELVDFGNPGACAPRWENEWVEGECEKFGNSTVVFARAVKQQPCPDAD